MTPLMLRIAFGHEDNKLLDHISTLEGFQQRSEMEDDTLDMCYSRLDIITRPGAI